MESVNVKQTMVVIFCHTGKKEIYVLVYFHPDLPYSCDFEIDLCGMTADTWVRRNGTIRSNDTGPNQAFSGDYFLSAENDVEQNGTTLL